MLCLFPSHVLQLLLLSFYTLKLCHFHQYLSLPHTAVFTVFWTSSKSILFISIQEIWDTAFPSGYELCMYPFPCCPNPVTKWSSLLYCPYGVSVSSPAKSPSEQILHTVPGGSCALSAASGTTCSFDIISHSLWPHLLSSTAAVRCLWNVSNNKPSPLAAACLGSCSKGSPARFSVKSPGISLLVLSPRSYSRGQLLYWHPFILHRAMFILAVNAADTTVIFFSSQRFCFCTYFLTGILAGLWDSVGLAVVLSGIWSHFTGMQWVSWWSLKGIVGKEKFSAIGKKHQCIICRWNSSCFWILPMRCFVPGLHLELWC